MAKFSLIPFEIKKAPNITIIAELNSTNDSVFVSFRVHLENSSINIDLGDGTPNKERKVSLWEKTCFELFIKNNKHEYVEFNFSPTFEWNCFYFKKSGDLLKEWESMQRPITDILLSKDTFLLIAEIKKEDFPKGFFYGNEELSAGITTVIKDKLGNMSYWALSHEDKKPNFHHFDSFRYKF